MAQPLRIAMVAGEASGDLLASHLIQALRAVLPDARFFGIGGPKMETAGFDVRESSDKLAVHGFSDALRHYREISGIRRRFLKELLASPPDLFIGIDAPDFNFGLEYKLKRKGITVVHYVSPSIWAWRGGRIKGIKRSVDHMLTLFPFEPEIYEKAGIPATYVGHPLADIIPLEINKPAAREKLGLDEQGKIFAILPGSRRSEVANLSDTFIQAAKLLYQRFPDARFLVPFTSRETRDMFEEALWQAGAQDMPVSMLFGHAHDAMAAADGILVASGTATLEAALHKCPMVIAYRMSDFSFGLMIRMAYLPYHGLPNILARRFIVPEFLQDEATPENLAQALGNQVEAASVTRQLENLLTDMHLTLRQGTAEKAAAAILPLLQKSRAWQGEAHAD